MEERDPWGSSTPVVRGAPGGPSTNREALLKPYVNVYHTYGNIRLNQLLILLPLISLLCEGAPDVCSEGPLDVFAAALENSKRH